MSDLVWLVRHASTAWTGRRWAGRSDVPLSAAGRSEARRLAERRAPLRDADVEIVSAPRCRATETAGAIATASGRGFTTDARLAEVDFGAAEGLTWAELERSHAATAREILAGAERVDWPAGESSAASVRRAADIRACVEGSGTALLLVTHGGFLRTLLAVFGTTVPSLVGPASARSLRCVEGRWTLGDLG